MPKKVFEINKEVQAVVDTNLCINCGRCRNVCPTGAMEEHQRLICHICPNCEGVCNFDLGWDKIKFHEESRKYATEIACSIGCPLGIQPEGYVNLVAQDDIDGAYQLIHEKNPLSSVCSYICSHPCQDKCKRGTLMDEPIKIRALKKYVMENANHPKTRFRIKYDKRIAIVGGGPAGITAAYDLAKKGYPVTIFEKDSKLGGAMNWGVPDFRLDKKMMDSEINELIDAGIDVEYNTKIEDPSILIDEGYEAVIIAIGASIGKKLKIENSEKPLVYDAVTIMTAFNSNKDIPLGQNAIVIGAGSVALDTARSLARKGVKARCYCVEDKDHITAPKEEVEDALSEGIEINTALSPKKINVKDGKVVGITFLKVSKTEMKDKRLNIETEDGTDFDVDCDMVIFATGQGVNTDNMNIELLPNGRIKVDKNLRTSKKKIFACGDCAGKSVNVITAMASGRDAALEVDNMIWNRKLKLRVEHELHESPDSEIIYPVRLEKIMPVKVEKIRDKEQKELESPIIDAKTSFENIEQSEHYGKCAVIGGGIDGIRKAISLRNAGNDVTIYERNYSLGGAYRYLYSDMFINKDELKEAIDNNIKGINVKLDRTVGTNPKLKDLKDGFDYIYLSVGENKGIKPNLENAESESCFDLITIQRKIANEEQEKWIRNNIIVIGSNSMAIDSARIIKKLGKEVKIVSKGKFEGTQRELEILKNSGIDVYEGLELSKIDSDFIYVKNVTFKKNNGEEITFECDGLIYGDKFERDTYLLEHNDKLKINDDGTTNYKNIFIKNISNKNEEFAEFNIIKANETSQEEKSFILEERTFTKKEAIKEAKRCMKCGYQYSVPEKCIGCGACYRVCPVNAITLEKVTE